MPEVVCPPPPLVETISSAAVGLPELELGLDPTATALRRASPGLHLVRVHRTPIGVVHIPENPAERQDALLDALGDAIAAHLTVDLGARPVPRDGSHLLDAARSVPHSACRWWTQRLGQRWSVIIATRNRPEALRSCLASILSARSNVEVIVVDNNSSHPDATEAAARSVAPGVKVMFEPVPGASRARNRGIAAASGDFVMLTDDDVVVDPLWFDAMERRFERQPELAAATGLVAPVSVSTTAEQLFEQFGGFGKGPAPRSFDLYRNRPPSPLFPWAAGQFGSGNNVAFRASVLSQVGGFDELLGPGTPTCAGEDLDLFVRTILAGHCLGYEPTALTWHQHRTQCDELLDQLRDYGVGLSAMVVRQLLRSPEHLGAIAKALPKGVYHLIGPGSDRNSNRERTYPRDLARAELRGVVRGPVALFRSHRRLAATPTGPRVRPAVGPPVAESGTRSPATRALRRSSASLVLNTMVTGVLGLVFWAVAARIYEADDVGRASAVVAAMALASAFGQLNLQQGIPRLLPGRRSQARAFLIRCYAAAGCASFVAAGLALLLLAGTDTPIITGQGERSLFIVATIAWTIFSLQDAALIGLRASHWVPIENIAFAVTKIVLAVVFVRSWPEAGLVAAWVVPVAASIGPVSWLLFRKLVPQHASASSDHPTLGPEGRSGGFMFADYAGQVLALGATSAMPVLVAVQTSNAATAYFAAAWMITAISEQVLGAVTTPLMVEAAHRPDELPRLTRQALRLFGGVFVPALFLVAVGAPSILAVLGRDYAESATGLLRWTCLGLVARAVVMIRLAHLRHLERRTHVVVMGGLSAAGLLGGSLALMPSLGIAAVGLSFFVTQFLLAVSSMPGIRIAVRPRAPAAAEPQVAVA